jgi:hypothetical protein
MTVLEADVRAVARELEELWPAIGRLDDVRYRVLVHMAFNMGVRGVLATNRFVRAVEWALGPGQRKKCLSHNGPIKNRIEPLYWLRWCGRDGMTPLR